jgi:hypothetical protein
MRTANSELEMSLTILGKVQELGAAVGQAIKEHTARESSVSAMRTREPDTRRASDLLGMTAAIGPTRLVV